MEQKQQKSINILEFLKPIVKELLEEIMLEERRKFQEENPESVGNGFYTRELMGIFGNIENLKVPRKKRFKIQKFNYSLQKKKV